MISQTDFSFMFVDIEGSTGLLRRLGSEYQILLGEYHRLVNRAVADHGGQVVSTEGDGFFAVFPGPVQASEAARDIQMAATQRSWPGGESVRGRIGLHSGAAVHTREGYVGLDVHIASRVGSAAQGGQILVSSATADAIADHARMAGWVLTDLGQYDLRGVGRSERLIRIDVPGLPVAAEMPRARPRTPSVVPAAPRPIIGRVADIEGATEMLMRDSVRLVTITGPGGTGKTRLAIEMANRLGDRFPDGIVFIELAAVRDRDRFLPVVGRALGVSESSGRSIIEALKGVFGDTRMLVVLDNMEQLVSAGPDVARILEALPKVRILVTSRSPLRIAWESEYPLAPLPVPEEGAVGEEIEQSDAVRLFADRARSVRPGFELNEVTRPLVAEVTRRLDGLPLAIELAAARLRSFSIEALLERLEDSLEILDRGIADLPERQRTLRGAIKWSHDLLDEDERVVFRRLSVFSGGWTLDAALVVCTDESIGENRVLDALEELVAKSLIAFSIDEEGRPRYRMLETLREFSLEELHAAGEEEGFRLRHLQWCHSLASRMLEVLQTPDFVPFLDVLEQDRFNLREGLGWSERSGQSTDIALEICGLLPLFWDTRGFVSEGLRWTRSLVAMTTKEGTTHPRAMALSAMGWLEMLAGEPDESEWALSTSVQMFRDLGDDNWLGRALAMQGMTTYNRNDLDAAEQQFDEAIELCRAYGLDWLADAWCVYGLAHIALARGQFMEATEMLHRALDYSRRHGLAWGIGHIQLSLGVVAFMTGELDQALERLSDSLRFRHELRDARGLCDCIGVMALLASVRADHVLAATLLGAADVAREATGQQAVPWLQPLLEQAVVSATANLGADYETRFAEGRALSIDETVELIMNRFSASGNDADQVEIPV